MKKPDAKKQLQILLLITSLILASGFVIPTSLTYNLKAAEVENTANRIAQTTTSNSSNQLYEPTMTKPELVDKNNNCIADTLDDEITQRILNNTNDKYTDVIVALKAKPTTQDAAIFTQHGGYLLTQLLTQAIYGFGGRIRYSQIISFAKSNPNVLLIEKEQICKAQIAYAAKQVGARTYVWNTLGLKGDPNSAIAIVDTGIDDSHSDFTPGYGNQNFNKKIVGWTDPMTETLSPIDDNGHGSHVAGLATGNGFFSTNASGNALASWGADLVGIPSSGTYFISGMMVNKTGTITINMKWKNSGTESLSALKLYYGDKSLDTGSWIQVASVSTPIQDTWYTLNYQVTSVPSGGYDMYHILMSLTAGSGDLYTMFQVSWPYNPPADSFPAWTGIAPQTKLVGAKVLDNSGSGSSLELLTALNWIITNRQAYHIVITSMSLGFGGEVTSVDLAVANLVKSGISTVISAGNSGGGSNYIYTPGSVDEAITVAATNQFDNIADYSSQGGTSRYKGKTMKPDIAAPGGSFFAAPLLSADSNDNEAEGAWPEVYLNDSALMQGTSMSAPVVAGAASIVIQALGGFSNWQWTRSQALLPKMVLLMTATETNPNLREYDTSYSPALDRGGKDIHEGYGRLNLDAAVDALSKTLTIGSIVTDTLGKPPTLTDISGLGQKLAWARKVQLNTQGKYNFTLTVPSNADFDLYLYNSTGTLYGEPATVSKSINATTGGVEQIVLTPPYNGTYYLIVKRATATTQGGTFTIHTGPEIQGDVNHDGFVDNTDLSLLTLAYGSTPTSVNWNPECDFNQDNIVNAMDLRILGKNYDRPS